MKYYCYIVCTLLLTTSALAQANTSKESVLYEISGKGLKKTSYLFGTIHVYDPNVIEIPQDVLDYLDKASTLVLEILPKEIEKGREQLVAGFISDYKDSTLSALLSEKAYQNLLSFPNTKMMGDNINLFIPLFAYQLLLFDNSWKSVEQHLTQHAEENNKMFLSLESIDEQIKALKSIAIKEQIEELEYLLNKENPQQFIKDLMNSLFNAYAQQSIGNFMETIEHAKFMLESSPQLVCERDKKMSDKIEELLKTPDNFFIAVGALHLQNKTEYGGIVNILRKKGYTLTPINVDLAKK